MDKPKNIEQLSEREQIKRLYHQLGLVYGRVFLTGDWEGEHKEKGPETGTLFDDVRSMDSASMLANELDSFLREIEPTTKSAVNPEDLAEPAERHDFNRRLFAEVLKYVGDILRQTNKDIGAKERIAMLKGVDENIHFFRDVPVRWEAGHVESLKKGAFLKSPSKEDWNTTESLKNITDRLVEIIESGTWREGPPESKAA
ncbi:MAG: hypothetical protein Q7R90_00395 [bacterium]|nr:hypothetical protein [bacterium]